MKIGVVSDSHDNVPMIRKAVEVLDREGVGAILHAGDFVAPFAAKELVKAKTPITAVFGNNDGERAGLAKVLPDVKPGPRLVDMAGITIVLTHDEGGIEATMLAQADVAVFGHTHMVVVERGKVLRLNPGECGGWLTGRCTIAILDAESLDVKVVDL
jgi:putative phosphoesterase